VSVTVAVHVVAVPVAGEEGEHATLVDVASVAAAADVGAASRPINTASKPNRRGRAITTYSGIRSWWSRRTSRARWGSV
jgi:hypothetical protein